MSLNSEFTEPLLKISKALHKLNKQNPKLIINLTNDKTIDIYTISLDKIKKNLEKTNLKPIQFSTSDWKKYILQQPDINIEIESLEEL